MDSFESVIKTILEHDGYWLRTGFKVELSKDEKRRIGRASTPRWELDLIAYHGATNELLVVECKSYLDSPGVKYRELLKPGRTNPYKLFNDKVLRTVVFARLTSQLVECGACARTPGIKLCLAAGKIATESDRVALAGHFSKQGWLLYDAMWIRERLTALASGGYENQVAAIVAKLLLRA